MKKGLTFYRLVEKKVFLIKISIYAVILFFIVSGIYLFKLSNYEHNIVKEIEKYKNIVREINFYSNEKYNILMNEYKIGNIEKLEDNISIFNDTINKYILKQENAFNNILKEELADYGIKSVTLKHQKFLNSSIIISNIDTITEEFNNSLDFINLSMVNILLDMDDIKDAFLSSKKNYVSITVLGFIFISIGLLSILFVCVDKLFREFKKIIGSVFEGMNTLGIFSMNENKLSSDQTILTDFSEEIKIFFYKIRKMSELIENINRNVSFDEILNYIYKSFSDFVPYKHIGVALLEDNNVIKSSHSISDSSLAYLSKEFIGIKANLKDTSLRQIIETGTPRIILDLENYVKEKSSVYNKILIDAGIKSSITLPLRGNEEILGVIFFSSDKKNAYTKDHMTFLEAISGSISVSLNKGIFIDELLYSNLLSLVKIVEEKDDNTYGHLERMKVYSVKITEFLLEDRVYADIIDLNFLKDIERFSPMHDIGKVGIRDEILKKTGKLTVDEYEEMKKHSIYGAEVLRTAEKNIAKHNKSMFKMGIDIVESHHEKWNGTGYPYKRVGQDIPLSARIVAIADVFDAITSKRPYKDAISFESAFDMVVNESGVFFDPQIVHAFVRHRDEIFQVYKNFHEVKNIENVAQYREYVLFTDSAADLPDGIISEMNITVIPMKLKFENSDYESYNVNQGFDIDNFYNRIRCGEKVSTIRVEEEIFEEYFEVALKQDKDIMYIGFSSGLSESYKNAVNASRKLMNKYVGLDIMCVDTKAASMGQGLLLYEAAKRKKEGFTISQLNRWLLNTRYKLFQLFTVDNTMYLKYGGRIGNLAAVVGTVFNIKPVFELDHQGKIASITSIKGRKNAICTIVNYMKNNYIHKVGNSIFIGHADCLEDAKYLQTIIRRQLNIKETVIGNISPIVGAHSGPGTVALFFIKNI